MDEKAWKEEEKAVEAWFFYPMHFWLFDSTRLSKALILSTYSDQIRRRLMDLFGKECRREGRKNEKYFAGESIRVSSWIWEMSAMMIMTGSMRKMTGRFVQIFLDADFYKEFSSSICCESWRSIISWVGFCILSFSPWKYEENDVRICLNFWDTEFLQIFKQTGETWGKWCSRSIFS